MPPFPVCTTAPALSMWIWRAPGGGIGDKHFLVPQLSPPHTHTPQPPPRVPNKQAKPGKQINKQNYVIERNKKNVQPKYRPWKMPLPLKELRCYSAATAYACIYIHPHPPWYTVWLIRPSYLFTQNLENEGNYVSWLFQTELGKHDPTSDNPYMHTGILWLSHQGSNIYIFQFPFHSIQKI